MARFEILGGRFQDGDGNIVVHRPGRRTIVESDKDLDILFKNSFRRLDEPVKSRKNKDHRDSADQSGGQVMDDLLDEQDDEIVDLKHGGKKVQGKAPRVLAAKQERHTARSVERDAEEDEEPDAEKEEDEDLEGLEESEAADDDAEAEAEAEDEAPAPVEKVSGKKPKKMKKKSK